MKKIKIKFNWKGKRKVWYPLQTLAFTLTLILLVLCITNVITTITAKPETEDMTEHYVSGGETLWGIYNNEYDEVDICWDKFSYEVKTLNGKKSFYEGEIILLPIYNK